MFRSYFLERNWRLWSWGGLAAILALIYIDVQFSVWFNAWYKEFYDLLQNPKDINMFWAQIKSFTVVAMASVFIETSSRYLESNWMFRWREAITQNLIPRWTKAVGQIEGASQRMQEDTMRFAKLVEHIAERAIRSVLILIAFIPILWGLSEFVVLPFVGKITGSLVIIALILSIGGIVVSWFVGIKLPGLEYNNQKTEAAFRKELVFSEESARNSGQAPTFFELFKKVKANYVRIFLHYTYFNTWKYTYIQFNIILPYMLMAPSLFTGLVTLGVLMQAGNAFDKVSNAFSFIINDWVVVTELRSVHKRLKEFETHLVEHTD